jgi:acetate kinase
VSVPPAVLTLNSGSSSLKAALFRADGSRRTWSYAPLGAGHALDHDAAVHALLADLDGETPGAIGHRFVHGGDVADAARALDAAEIARLEALVPLAPLHLPANLLGVALCARHFDVPQVACFDTAFHHTLPEVARRLPIPAALGLRRYGFHGLNYAWLARRLPALLGPRAHGRVVAAHLGAGASLCLLDDLRSVDTSMGYSPAGGIPMATRSGDLDPGVMLELARRHDAERLGRLVYEEMGLVALADGESADMRTLLHSPSPAAAFAVDYFCRAVRGAIGAFAAKAGGIDALVFSGGIGENAAAVRAAICAPLDFLGFALDPAANAANATFLGAAGSKPVLRIAADEEAVIRDLVLHTLAAP